MNIWTLAWAWIRHRPLGAALNAAMLALGTATIALLLIATEQFEARLENDANAVDMVVGAKGSPLQLVLSSVFHVDAPVGNVRAEDAQVLLENPMVERIIPLAMGDAFGGFRIVGTEPSYLELYGAEPATGRLWEQPLEAVLGAATAARSRLEMGDLFVGAHGIGGPDHVDYPYTVVGILAPTGTVVDRLVLTSVDTVQIVHGMEPDHHHDEDHGHDEDHHHDEAAGHEDHGDDEHSQHTDEAASHSLEEHDDHSDSEAHPNDANWPGAETTNPDEPRPLEVTAFLVDFATPMAAVALPREINRNTAMQAARPAHEIRRLFRLVGIGAEVVRAFAFILVAGALLGLFTTLFQALEERRTDLAMMRVLGATRQRLFWQILAESLILTVTGIVLGLVIAHGLAWGASQWLWMQNHVLVSFGWAVGETGLVATVLALGLLAALPSALRATRIDIPKVLSAG